MLLGTPTDESLIRVTVEEADLGGGLSRVVAAWQGREHPAAPLQQLGTADGFALDFGDGRDPLELEIDTNYREWERRVHLLWPDGAIDASNTAAQLLELAALLGRAEVLAALQAWAAEDAEVQHAA